MSVNPARAGIEVFDVTWNTYNFGGVDKVTPNIPLKLDPLKIGSMGDLKLDDQVIGFDDNAEIIVEAREIDAAFFQKMCPWWSSGPIALTPATPNTRLYGYAALLTLHASIAGGTTLDINISKAVPIRAIFPTDGKVQKVSTISFKMYPDRTQFPNISYGYIGTPPS